MSRTNANSDQQNRPWTPRHSSTCHVQMQIVINKRWGTPRHQHVTYRCKQWSTKDGGHQDTSMSRTNTNSDQQKTGGGGGGGDTKSQQRVSRTNTNSGQQKGTPSHNNTCHVQIQTVVNKRQGTPKRNACHVQLQWSTKDGGHQDTSMSRTNANSDQQKMDTKTPACHVQMQTVINKRWGTPRHQHVAYKCKQWSTKDGVHQDTTATTHVSASP